MTTPENDVDSFIDALRSDLPTDEDEARIRARLLAAGVAITAGLSVSSAAAGAAGAAGAGAKVSLLPKIAGLSFASKVGLATVVMATAGTIPIATHLSSRSEPAERAPRVLPAQSRAMDALAAQRQRNEAVVTSQAMAASPRTVSPLAPAVSPDAPPPKLVRRDPASGAVAERTTPPSAATGARSPLSTEAPPDSASTAAVGAFPAIDEGSKPSASSTLREETELIEQALAALRSGDAAKASLFLGEHARRFPNGALVRERGRALERVAGGN